MKNLLTYLRNNPFEGKQEQCGKGKHYWNADMWTIEVVRYMIQGRNYNVPEKFKGNKFVNPLRLKKDVQIKNNMKKVLESKKDTADVLVIGEVGRGLDIFVANQVKKWKTIICYDRFNYQKYLEIFGNVHFIQGVTSHFDPSWISDKHIFIINGSIYRDFERFKKVSEHGIIDGELKW